MNHLNLCFILKSSRLGPFQEEHFERDYQSVYKPIVKFLYANPGFKVAFSFNGVQLEYIQKKYSEFIEILKQLISRKQVEIIGGGFYDPVFPLLLPVDRTGQIEKLTSQIRFLTGKRPRGVSICGSIWDYSLITSFNTCGMDYVFLDESLIPSEKLKFIPLLMSEKGKSISILPLYQTLKPDPDQSAYEYREELVKKVQKMSKSVPSYFYDSPRSASIIFSHGEFASLLQSGWFEQFYRACREDITGSVELQTPVTALKETDARLPAYIYSGMNGEIAQWGIKPYESVKLDKRYPTTIYDFFQIYPQSNALYNRMLYVSMLVQQSHGDKIRKNTAREKLWEAQNGDGFICTSKGAFVSSSFRQQAYKKLTEAEKILRECGHFKESINTIDYTNSGIKDYVCRMNRYFAVISKLGGAVRELDVFQNSGNFADNLNRAQDFEGFTDDYDRGLFIDHVFDDAEFDAYLENKPTGTEIFSNYLYTETKFSEQHSEICLEASAHYKNRQQILLKKKYITNSNGMMIQYILKNESTQPLKAKFAVESSFAQTNFNQKDFNAFKLEILSDSMKKEIDTKSSSYALNESGKLSDVEGIWITDTDNNISFVYEPNESCGLSFVPIIFNRPEYTTGEIVPASMTFSSTLFWDIELAPGMEMEKTINFTILGQHKRKKIL